MSILLSTHAARSHPRIDSLFNRVIPLSVFNDLSRSPTLPMRVAVAGMVFFTDISCPNGVVLYKPSQILTHCTRLQPFSAQETFTSSTKLADSVFNSLKCLYEFWQTVRGPATCLLNCETGGNEFVPNGGKSALDASVETVSSPPVGTFPTSGLETPKVISCFIKIIAHEVNQKSVVPVVPKSSRMLPPAAEPEPSYCSSLGAHKNIWQLFVCRLLQRALE